jgi:hypothetical protein
METTESCCVLLDIGPPVLQRVLGPFNYILPILVIIIHYSSLIRLHDLIHSNDQVLAHVKVSGAQSLIFSWSDVFVTLICTLLLALTLGCLCMERGTLILGNVEIKWTIITLAPTTNNIIQIIKP